MFLGRRLNIINISVLSHSIYRFKAIPFNIPKGRGMWAAVGVGRAIVLHPMKA